MESTDFATPDLARELKRLSVGRCPGSSWISGIWTASSPASLAAIEDATPVRWSKESDYVIRARGPGLTN